MSVFLEERQKIHEQLCQWIKDDPSNSQYGTLWKVISEAVPKMTWFLTFCGERWRKMRRFVALVPVRFSY